MIPATIQLLKIFSKSESILRMLQANLYPLFRYKTITFEKYFYTFLFLRILSSRINTLAYFIFI